MIRVLSFILIVQLLAVAVLYWPQTDDLRATEALLTGVSPADIRSIRISSQADDDSADKPSIALIYGNDRWLLESGLPADATKVGILLSALLNSDPGYAIATSENAAKRFQVAAEDFERRIELETQAGLQTVFLGSSPSFRKVHARRDGDSGIYVLELNAYDAPADEEAWLERSLLAQRNLTGMRLYGVDFTRSNDAWTRSDGAPVSKDEIQALVQILGSLQVNSILNAGDAQIIAADESLRLSVSSETGEQGLTVLQNPESENYYLRAEGFEQAFGTSAYDAERLIEATQALLQLAQATETESEDVTEQNENAGEGESTAEDPNAAMP